jgi:hypothetical protein
VEALACWQPLAPLQTPVLPQGALVLVGHWPAGAGVPAARGVHAPGAEPLHVWQVPHAVLPQQAPSMQLPLMHWFAAVQASPLALRAQLRLGGAPWQVNGARQCESIEQVLRQVSVPHVYGVQLERVGDAQAPVPLHRDVGVYVDPLQDCIPHETEVAASWQAPAPLQAPVFPQGGIGVQRFIVSCAPAGMFVQLPALAPTLHALQSAQELVLQQTPSTQKFPVRHSLVAVHAWPRRLSRPQRLVWRSQMFGGRQSPSLEHAARQAVEPLQT